jgi:uncharacterized protein
MSARTISIPFLAGSPIVDPQFFVGREAELDAITARMTGVRCVSVNLVGKRRSGKSSLLRHFAQTYRQRVENPNRYAAIYLDLQDPQCRRENGFYLTVVRKLLDCPSVGQQRTLIRPLKNLKSLDRQSFSMVLGEWKRQGVLPVLCLDEFEALLRRPREFDEGFFDHLRSLIASNILMLVVTSHRRLDFYRRRYKLNSAFFEFEEVISLGQLTQQEAWELLSLPARKGLPSALSVEEQQLAKKWGGCHPFLLQLAANLLWEARQTRQDLSWALAKFEQEARRLPKPFWKMPPIFTGFFQRT